MNFKNSIQKHIRGESNDFSSVREKLKDTPKKLSDIRKIVGTQHKIEKTLITYYEKKGLK